MSKTLFFKYKDLSEMLKAIERYETFIRMMTERRRLNDVIRVLAVIESSPINTDDVVRGIISLLSDKEVFLLLTIGDLVPLSVPDMREEKRKMYNRIADILSRKALNIIQHHTAFKRSFKYTPSDDKGLRTYFRDNITSMVDLAEYRSSIRTMHYKCQIARIEELEAEERYLRRQEQEDEDDRRRRARRGFQYDYSDHEIELSQNGYRRAWYSGRRYGAGSDSDSD